MYYHPRRNRNHRKKKGFPVVILSFHCDNSGKTFVDIELVISDRNFVSEHFWTPPRRYSSTTPTPPFQVDR